MMQIAEAIKLAKQQLAHSATAQLDAEVLLCHCLDCDRSRVYAYPDKELPATVDTRFFQLVEQRAAGHPVAHLIASREFWSLRLQVTPATLIPRPETECLVEAALPLIPAEQPCSILDLGTGSGAIAIAIASERPLASVTATDISDAALNVAKGNASRHQLHNIRFVQADWFDFEMDTPFDIIISNPPYISPDDTHLEQGDVRFEARSALVADAEGLAAIRTIVQHASAHLQPNGWLLVEHGFQQGDAVRALFTEHDFKQVSTGQDYAGLDRYSMGQYQR